MKKNVKEINPRERIETDVHMREKVMLTSWSLLVRTDQIHTELFHILSDVVVSG